MIKIICILSLFFLPEKVEAFDDFLSKFHQTGYKVQFERCVLDYYNQSYLKDIKITTFKYNRTQAVMNITFVPLLDFGFDAEVLVQVYKLSNSNDYRTFPIRFQMNYCSAIEHDIAGLGKNFNQGNSCPFKKGITYGLKNFYPDESQLPPFLPNGRYKADIHFMYFNNDAFLMIMYVKVYRPVLPA